MLTLPTQPKAASAASPLTTPRIYRAGRLTQAEEIMEENEDISSLNQAVTMMQLPRFTLKGAASTTWVQETGGEALTLEISAADSNWTVTESLPMYDESGNKYYYWAEETAIGGASTLSAFDVAYKFADGTNDTTYCIDAVAHGDSEITIRNTPKDTPPEGTLPATGGRGTAMYYTIGGMLLMLGAAGYVTIRRRRWFDG